MHRSISRRIPFAIIMLAFMIVGAGGQTVQTPAQPTQPAPLQPWVAFVSAVSWPIAALVITLVFRKPLGDFFRGLAGRITKLSAFKVELELAPAPNAAASPLIDDIRSATTSALISDSSRMMLDQAQSTLPADFAVINLGSGEEWLTSRLYIAAVMLERMRNVKVIVFLESTTTTTRRFVAVAPISQLRWSLAQRFPWLEVGWICSYLSIFPGTPQGAIAVSNGAAGLPDPRTLTIKPSPIESLSGALNPWQARQVVSQFINLLQQQTVAGQPPMQPHVILGSATSPAQERADWVTRPLLETLLPTDVFDLWADAGRDEPRIRRTRSVLRQPAPFVALVQGTDREYVRLVNRAALLEEIAASLGEEPESNRG